MKRDGAEVTCVSAGNKKGAASNSSKQTNKELFKTVLTTIKAMDNWDILSSLLKFKYA